MRLTMKRLFAAIKIEPSADFNLAYDQLTSSLRHERIKWVEPYNIHITLKFFGETDEKMIPEINKVLQASARLSGSFTLKINKTGIFGSRYDPRVVWFGIDPEPGMDNLAKNTVVQLQKAGWEPDRQNFVPHLTIGRIKEIKDKALFQKIIASFQDVVLQEQEITEIILFESILRREGPLYVKIASFPLGE
jgi:RNA 2',3'-cyclic 3'-phosphodiesterase